MARNWVQFQKGLSLTDFNRKYGTEGQCEVAVNAWRWPDGFICPRCGCREHAIVGVRRLHLCHGYHRQPTGLPFSPLTQTSVRHRSSQQVLASRPNVFQNAPLSPAEWRRILAETRHRQGNVFTHRIY